MSDMFQRLAHGFPDRAVPTRTSFATDARGIAQWVAALPLANPLTASRVLLQGLKELNGLRIDAALRLNALEAMRSPLAQIVAQADRQVVGSTFPLPLS